MALEKCEPIQVRLGLMSTPCKCLCSDEYLETTSKQLHNAAVYVMDHAPPDIDVGRTIAFIDKLLEAKAVLRNAVLIGAGVKRSRTEMENVTPAAAAAAPAAAVVTKKT